jgi:hypothetical protein
MARWALDLTLDFAPEVMLGELALEIHHIMQRRTLS